MLEISYSTRFKKDVNLAKKRGKDLNKLKNIITLLVNKQDIPQNFKDHILYGNWQGYRDIHIESDWILIYKIDKNMIKFERTGTHADLF